MFIHIPYITSYVIKFSVIIYYIILNVIFSSCYLKLSGITIRPSSPIFLLSLLTTRNTLYLIESVRFTNDALLYIYYIQFINKILTYIK